MKSVQYESNWRISISTTRENLNYPEEFTYLVRGSYVDVLLVQGEICWFIHIVLLLFWDYLYHSRSLYRFNWFPVLKIHLLSVFCCFHLFLKTLACRNYGL